MPTEKPGTGRARRQALPSIRSFRQLGDLMSKPRDLPAGIVLVNNIALRRFHQLGLGMRHRLQGCVAVTALDRVLGAADRAAHLGSARFVDYGAAGNLACRLFGGSRIGHGLKFPSALIVWS